MGEIREFQPSSLPEKNNPPFKVEQKRTVKRAGRINEHTLRTKENLKASEAPKSERFGHQAEYWLAEDLKKVPGVRDVVMADNISDSEKRDLDVIFQGGFRLPLQVTTNPEAIQKKIKEVDKETVVIYVNKRDFEPVKKPNEVPDLTKDALKRIAHKILSRIPKRNLNELMGYHRI